MSDIDVRTMQNAGDADIRVNRYSDERGDMKVADARISRPAGVVAKRENNSRDIASFRGAEQMRRTRAR